MAGLTGLFQRGSSYYIQVVLPLSHPLRSTFKNGKFVESLGPCSYREALQKGTIKRAHVLYGTGSPTALPFKAVQHSLRDIHSKWKSSKARSSDTINACLRAVRLYEDFTGNLPIEALPRELGHTFRVWLEQPSQNTTCKTARDRLIWVKSLLEFAATDLGLIQKNPWAGIDIGFRTTNKRRPWMDEELTHLFEQPLHTAYQLPEERKAGKDAAYWIPLLGLFTGARVGELAQLNIADVHTVGTVPKVSITNTGDGQRVKTQAGLRDVPIHSELIRLGFLEYVAKARQGTGDSLWPDLPMRDGKPGGYFSQWFGVYRRGLGFEKAPDFHCFRHTVRTQMAEAGVQEAVIDALLGHESSGSIGAKVYTHRGLATLRIAIEELHYPFLFLPAAWSSHPSAQLRVEPK